VIESDPTDDPRVLGDWLREAGLDLDVVRPHAGDALPADLEAHAALIVLGGDQHAYPGPDGQPGAPWFDAVESLLRKAVRGNVPTLGICLGAQLLAVAHAGTVELSPAGPEIGAQLVAKRDAAEKDPLFGPLPMLPDVGSGTPTRSPSCRWGRPCWPRRPTTRTRPSGSDSGRGDSSSTSSATPR